MHVHHEHRNIAQFPNGTQAMLIEPRWPVALAIVAVLFLVTALPGRVRVFPPWVPFLMVVVLIVPMAALSLSTARTQWLRIEGIVIAIFLASVGFSTIIVLKDLFSRMLRPSAEITGLQLLTSSIAVWTTNVLLFSLAYWRIDRGGPEARTNHATTKPDWLFPQEGAAENTRPDWHPTFVDYLFLAFCTATAFSPTDALPLTPRAKLLIMLESIVSLVTIIAVASRAINILGS